MLPVGEASHFSKKRMTLRSLGQSMEGSKPRTFEQLNGMSRSEKGFWLSHLRAVLELTHLKWPGTSAPCNTKATKLSESMAGELDFES